MYLFIFEDGEVKTSSTASDEDLQAVDDGMLSVVEISGGKPMEYYAGKWHEVKSADEGE